MLAAQLTPTPEPTPAIVNAGDYLMVLLQEIEQIGQGMILMQESLPSGEYVPGDWQTDLQQGIDILLQAQATIDSLQTPEALHELRTLVRQSSADCTQAAHLLAEALRQQENGNYQAAQPLLLGCKQGYNTLIHALEVALEAHW
jgi:hypothetical protein